MAKKVTQAELARQKEELKAERAKARAAAAKAKEAGAKARVKALERARAAGARTQLDGFMDFVRTQGVVGLAIGIVIGTQVKSLTDQLIASFINPLLGLVLPGAGDLAQKHFTLTVGSKVAVFNYGAFVAVLISFLTVAAVIYYIIKGLKLDKLDKKKD